MSIQLPKIIDGHITSKALTFQNYTTPYALTTLQLPTSSKDIITKPTQVLIKVEAVGLNPSDVILLDFVPKRFPGSISKSVKVGGGDFAGTVLQVGSEVKGIDFQIGDTVLGGLIDGLSQKRAFQEYLLLDIKDFATIMKVPEGLPLEQAAGLSIVGGTAYTCFSRGHKSINGGNVLVLGAGSSVGIMGLQFSRYFGAKFVAATSSLRASEMAKASGADEVIDYTKGAASEANQVLEIVKKHGKFDFIFDAVRDDSLLDVLDQVLKTKKEGGKLSIVSGSFGHDGKTTYYSMIPTFKFFRTLLSHAIGFSKFDIYVLPLLEKNEGFVDAINTLQKQGTLNLPIDSIYNFYTQHEEAFQKIGDNKAKGKVILLLEEPK